ncbi:MAG: hypothetical protein JSV86_20855 [Gemmatimonadota bacterium]|nr:MAG: hypothetical protein JSV86_20855 [Gemmatimonadota bacterium]
MTVYYWLGAILSLAAIALLILGGYLAIVRRRRLRIPPREGWLSDDMIDQIIERGMLSEQSVPERALDLEQIAKEEERFWTETWDDPERYWD